jgi:hypothetical protein
MMAKNCTLLDLDRTLSQVNLKFDENIKFKRLESKGKNILFTLTVKDSRKPGSRTSASVFHHDRRVAAACWHVHGWFFEILFKVNPAAIVVSQGNKQITKDSGNWQDWQIGPQIYPIMYSEACDCNK